MATPALPKGFLTLTEANAIAALSGDSDWTGATDAAKGDALSYGRAYIDAKYSCGTIDEDDVDAEIKMANALFALQHVKGELYKEPEREVTRERVEAGEVVTDESYATSGGARRIDPHPTITAILAAHCRYKGGSVGNGFLIRA